jgi:DNA-binding IclR family transcriptional regulator
MVPYLGTAMCIETQAGGWSAPPPVSIGTTVAYNVTSAARVLMAYMRPDEQSSFLAGPLAARTALTPTDPSEVSARYDRIRERGWDASHGHVQPGIWSIAIPIRDASGTVVASLGIAGTDTAIEDEGRPRHLDVMFEKLREWEQRFGPAFAVGANPNRPSDNSA